MALLFFVKLHDHGGGSLGDYLGAYGGMLLGAILLLKVPASYVDRHGRLREYSESNEEHGKQKDIFF